MDFVRDNPGEPVPEVYTNNSHICNYLYVYAAHHWQPQYYPIMAAGKKFTLQYNLL